MQEERRPLIATYMLASRPFGVIYVGVSSNLFLRGYQHRNGLVDGFSKDKGAGLLVWYEPHELITVAIRREKTLKKWNRAWKMQLIEQRNPDWLDLYPSLIGDEPDPRLPAADADPYGVEAFLERLRRGEIMDE